MRPFHFVWLDLPKDLSREIHLQNLPKMKLTTEQIEQIKQFIHSRGFTYIEVEMEILDHVASAVEGKLEKEPKKPIEQAIREVHKSFGPLGFSTFEDSFHKSFRQHYWTIQKNVLRQYFSLEKGWITLSVVLASISLSFLLRELPVEAKMVFVLIISTALWLMPFLYFRKRFKQWRKKSIVIGTQLSRIGLGMYIINYSYYYTNEFLDAQLNTLPILTIVFSLVTIFFLFTKDCIEQVYTWANERYLKYA